MQIVTYLIFISTIIHVYSQVNRIPQSLDQQYKLIDKSLRIVEKSFQNLYDKVLPKLQHLSSTNSTASVKYEAIYDELNSLKNDLNRINNYIDYYSNTAIQKNSSEIPTLFRKSLFNIHMLGMQLKNLRNEFCRVDNQPSKCSSKINDDELAFRIDILENQYRKLNNKTKLAVSLRNELVHASGANDKDKKIVERFPDLHVIQVELSQCRRNLDKLYYIHFNVHSKPNLNRTEMQIISTNFSTKLKNLQIKFTNIDSRLSNIYRNIIDDNNQDLRRLIDDIDQEYFNLQSEIKQNISKNGHREQFVKQLDDRNIQLQQIRPTIDHLKLSLDKFVLVVKSKSNTGTNIETVFKQQDFLRQTDEVKKKLDALKDKIQAMQNYEHHLNETLQKMTMIIDDKRQVLDQIYEETDDKQKTIAKPGYSSSCSVCKQLEKDLDDMKYCSTELQNVLRTNKLDDSQCQALISSFYKTAEEFDISLHSHCENINHSLKACKEIEPITNRVKMILKKRSDLKLLQDKTADLLSSSLNSDQAFEEIKEKFQNLTSDLNVILEFSEAVIRKCIKDWRSWSKVEMEEFKKIVCHAETRMSELEKRILALNQEIKIYYNTHKIHKMSEQIVDINQDKHQDNTAVADGTNDIIKAMNSVHEKFSNIIETAVNYTERNAVVKKTMDFVRRIEDYYKDEREVRKIHESIRAELENLVYKNINDTQSNRLKLLQKIHDLDFNVDNLAGQWADILLVSMELPKECSKTK